MSKKNRSFLLVSLLPIVLFGSVCAVGQAQEATSPEIRHTLWSDPATWPDDKVPAAGDKVTIERGKEVILDVSPPPLSGLHIEGELSFSDKADIELTTEWILLIGKLEIGTEAKPHTRKATITAPQRTGERLVGHLRAAGIRDCCLGYAAGQPGCTADGQRHLVLQGQGLALGQSRLQRRRRPH